MSVEWTGDKGCYHVDSTDSTEKYLVDILELKGADLRCNGQCSCTDFRTRCHPEWNKSGIIVERDKPGYTRCKHIAAVIMCIGNRIFDTNPMMQDIPRTDSAVYAAGNQYCDRMSIQ
jgi:hypothetical protein